MTRAHAPEGDRLLDLGLIEGDGMRHPGQGTANRRFFFANGYLELIWVEDEAEVKQPLIAPTRLWERFRHSQTGYSPFGLCVRSQEPLEEAWSYTPPYLPPGMAIQVLKNEDHPEEPLIFRSPSNRPPAPCPEHPVGFQRLSRVDLQWPGAENRSVALRGLETLGLLHITPGTAPIMTLTFDDEQLNKQFDLRPEIPLILRG